jgi:hypothetical protein
MFGSCFLMIDCYLVQIQYSKGSVPHVLCAAPLSIYSVCPVVTKCLILKFLHLTLFLQRRTYNTECKLLTEQVYQHAQQPP